MTPRAGCLCSALGDTHVDTLVTEHNIAELLIAMGQKDKAAAMQQAMLDRLGYTPPADAPPS